MSLRTSGASGRNGGTTTSWRRLPERSPTPGSKERWGLAGAVPEGERPVLRSILQEVHEVGRVVRLADAFGRGLQLPVGPRGSGGVSLPPAHLPVPRAPELAGRSHGIARGLEQVGPGGVGAREGRGVGPRAFDHPAVAAREESRPGGRAAGGGGEGLRKEGPRAGHAIERRRRDSRVPICRRVDPGLVVADGKEDVGSPLLGRYGHGREKCDHQNQTRRTHSTRSLQ